MRLTPPWQELLTHVDVVFDKVLQFGRSVTCTESEDPLSTVQTTMRLTPPWQELLTHVDVVFDKVLQFGRSGDLH